jgi:phenylalanyl-tRNA synthetase beta chain
MVEDKIVEVRWKNIDRLIGKKIEHELIIKILLSLDFRIESATEEGMKLLVPFYRVDVSREADIIEEILRIYGYNKIETSEHLNSTLTYLQKPDREKAINTIADLLAANGFCEMMSNSLVPGQWFEGNDHFKPESLVKLANPLSNDLNVMRQSLLPGGLSAVGYNINRQNLNLRLFEFGNCYFGGQETGINRKVENFSEKFDLDLFMSGNTTINSWNAPENPTDFFFMKSFVEMVLTRMGIDPVKTGKEESTTGYYTESISYMVNKKSVASVGKISKDYLNRFNIKQDVFHGHIEWDIIMGIIKNGVIEHKSLPKFPSVRRDLALLVGKNVKFEDIKNTAFGIEKNILREVGLFDVYENESLGADKKSYAVSFILRDDLRTLNDKGIEKIMENLAKGFESAIGATVRK